MAAFRFPTLGAVLSQVGSAARRRVKLRRTRLASRWFGNTASRLGLAMAASLIFGAFPPAQAAEPTKKPGAGQYFNISPVGVPVISNGRLVNYVFVALRLNIRPGLDATAIGRKEPFFRDALVRLGHRVALNPPHDLNRLDEPTVKARMMAESARIAGPGVVTSVEILSQAPQHRLVPSAP